MAQDNVQYDINGYKVITKAMRELLNQFPLLRDNEQFDFSTIAEDEGLAFYPTSGAVIQNKKEDITGWVEQNCYYPMIVFNRAGGLSQNGKADTKEWLDTLGRWLARHVIEVDGKEYQLTQYPPLNGNYEFTDISSAPSYLLDSTDDKIDTWAIEITATYKHKYKKL